MITNPDYALEFFSISVEVTATILGFAIVFWVFWWENIGKYIKFELGTRVKCYSFNNFYIKFENYFFRNFLHGRLLNKNITYGMIFKITQLGFLYVHIRRKTENIFFQLEYKRLNLRKLLFLIYTIFVIIIGTYYIYYNVTIIRIMNFFSIEQLSGDKTFQSIINNSYYIFYYFIIIMTFYIITIILHTFYYRKSESDSKSRYEVGYIY